MKKFILCLLVMTSFLATAGGDHKLKDTIAGKHRKAENAARDQYRHPYETLKFFGVKDNMTVFEVWPGGGWYSEILAAYLKDNGKFIAGVYDQNPETQAKWMARVFKGYKNDILDKPQHYGKVDYISLDVKNTENPKLAPDGSLDMILDFRNAHNWMKWGGDKMVKAWFDALKSGGVVGVVDHELAAGQEYSPKTGYIHKKQLVEIMEKHGFKLDAESKVNKNPKDTTNHPNGVWTLPPSKAHEEADAKKYMAIGESNRLTLRFVKP